MMSSIDVSKQLVRVLAHPWCVLALHILFALIVEASIKFRFGMLRRFTEQLFPNYQAAGASQINIA